MRKLKWLYFIGLFQLLTQGLIAQTQFDTEEDPKLSNGVVHINQYLNGIELEPSVVVAGKVTFEMYNPTLTQLGIWFIRWDLDGDGNWDTGYKKVGDVTSSDLTRTYNAINTPGDTLAVKIKFGYKNLLFQDIGEDEVYLTLIQTADKRYSKSGSFLDRYYGQNNSLHNKPILVVEGFDPLNTTYPSFYYNLMRSFVKNDLLANGYDVFFLNFSDGGRDLRQNADTLLAALDKINAVCGSGNNVILAGLSMGGVISRYALAKAESVSRNHHVQTFITFDSPHKGANISPDLQDWVYTQDPNSSGTIKAMQNSLKSMAAKQLLLYNTYNPNKSEHISFYGVNYDFNGLNVDGFPHLSKNYAISNGNFKATYGSDRNGSHILDFTVAGLATSVTSQNNDNGSGSMLTDMTTVKRGSIAPISALALPSTFIDWSLTIQYNPVFIPTWSSLFIPKDKPSGSNFNSNLDIIDTAVTKFDGYLVQKTPVQHHVLTPESREKILLWAEIGPKVIVDQVNNQNQSVGNVFRWKNSSFQTIQKNTPFTAVKNSTEVLRGDQSVISNQKYQIWKKGTVNESNVNNHHEFTITADVSYTSHFSDITSASLKATVDGIDFPSGYVRFKDPWLIDFADPNYGNSLRNRGMSEAAASPVTSEVGNLGTGTVYKGVFKNLPIDVNKPYYKILSNQVENFGDLSVYLQNWSATGASIANLNSGTEQPVTFTADNATVTANYKGILTSNTSGWVQSGMENFNGTEAVLYPSMNELWLHIEESELGSLSKEIKVASASEQASRYSVVKNGFGTFVSYVNNQGKIILKKYNQFGSLVASADLNNSTLPSGVTPKIGVGGYWYTLPKGFDEPIFINNLYVLYQNGSTVSYKTFNPNDSVFPAGTWSSSGVLTGLSGGELQLATNGNYGYIFWFNGTNVYFCQLMDYFNSVFTASTNPTGISGGMIDYVSGAVDGYGNLNLVYSRHDCSVA